MPSDSKWPFSRILTPSGKDTSLISICRRVTSNQAIPTGTNTAINFNSEDLDPADMHDAITLSRFTVPTAGAYLCVGGVTFAANSTGGRSLRVRVNGSDLKGATRYPTVDANVHRFMTADVVNLAANDFVEFIAFQNSGGDLDVVADPATFGAVAYLGA